MQVIADLLISAVDFLEAEMSAAKRAVFKLLLAGSLLAVVFILLSVGVVLLVRGLYVLLEPTAGEAGATFIAAGFALLLSAIMVIVSLRLAR